MRAVRATIAALTTCLSLMACACAVEVPPPPTPAKPAATAQSPKFDTDPDEPAAPTQGAPPTDPKDLQELANGIMIPKHLANGIPILTPMEFALLRIDPKDLEIPQRRKRGFAKRKIVMNNPDSATARALNDLAKAHRAGELDVPAKDNGTWLSLPGTKPTRGLPPAGSRPPAGAEAEPSAGG